MYDYRDFKLMHRHGPDDWAKLRPHNPHDAASYDPERTWGEGAQLFKCTRCDEEVVVVPTDPQDRDIP